MNRDHEIFIGTSIIPATLGVLALLVLAFLMGSDNIDVSGAEFYNVQSVSGEKVVGLYKGVIWSGDIIANGDVINITAINASTPSPIPTGDLLVIDLIVNNSAGVTQYRTNWGLTYNGAGAEFTGNITLDKDQKEDTVPMPDGISIRVEDGFRLTLRKNNTNDAPLLYLTIDTSGPTISPVEPGSSIAVYSDTTYAKKGGGLNLQISDVSEDQTWFISNSKVTYWWDMGSQSTWTGSGITIPGTTGNHTLHANATDKFGHWTAWSKTYFVTDFLTDTTITSNTTIDSGVVFVSDTTVPEGISLSLTDTEVIFLNWDDGLIVNEGGSLSITGSVITSLGDHYSIITHPGSELTMNNSEIIGAGFALDTSSSLVLGSGNIENVTFTDIPNRITICSPGVTITHSNISFTGTGSLFIDYEHRWGPEPTNLFNLSIEGQVNRPVQIRNISTYVPYDMTTRYYEDDTSGNAYIYLDTTDVVNPYLKLPNFVDSRDPHAVFDIRYNNSGTWESFPGYPVSDLTYREWVNGEDGKIDLSILPEGGHKLNVSWEAEGEKDGCVHLGLPTFGGDNINERKPGSPSLNIDYSKFGTIADGDVLVIKNITVENAVDTFVHVLSSGGVNISELHLGKIGSIMGARELVTVVNSSILLSDSELVAGNLSEKAVSFRFTAGNDWASSFIGNVSISLNGTNDLDPAIQVIGGTVEMVDINIRDATVGVMVSGGFLNTDRVNIDPTDSGIIIELPPSYPLKRTLSIESLKVGNKYSSSGLMLKGQGLDYDINMIVSNFDLTSAGNKTYTRSQGIGSLTLDLTSDRSADALISGNVNRGKTHGIAVQKWPAASLVRIEDFRIDNVDLDGIYIGEDINANISRGSISRAKLTGIYASNGTNIGITGSPSQMLTISNIQSGGGVWLGDDVDLYLNRINITSCASNGFVAGKGASGIVSDVDIFRCKSGVRLNEGSTVEIYGLVVNGNSIGVGLWADSCDLTVGRNSRNTVINNSNGDGIFMDGGSLNISRTWIQDNSGKGMTLLGVDLRMIKDIKIERNGDDGLGIHIPSDLLLDPDGTYCILENCIIMDNSGVGLPVTFDPTGVTKQIEVRLSGPRIGGNSGGDIIASKTVHFSWSSQTSGVGLNVLGSNLVSGVVRANIDIVVGNSAYAELLNLNITLLGSNNRFQVMDSGTLRLEYCYIRPSQSTKSFSIDGGTSSTVQVIGGYLGQLYRLEMIDGKSFYMDGTLVRFGEGPIMLRSTPLRISNSEVSEIEGTGLMIINGEGSISGTKFTDNTIGIMVEGLSDDLDIINCEITDNKWGISLFNDSGRMVSIKDSYFVGNSPSPIWTATANAYLLDTYIDPYKVQVTQSGYTIHVSYSLDLRLINELGQNVEFDLTVDRGPGKSIQVFEDRTSGFSGDFESYIIRSDTVYADLVNIRVTLNYIEGEVDGTSVTATITDSFKLNTGISATYYGYQAPKKTVKFLGKLQALEDRGLKDGSVDVSVWFTDIGADRGNLTFSAATLTKEIVPVLDASILTLSLQKDWNGMGNITVTATDPHGVSLTLRVNVNVLGTNDQPAVSDPRIISKNSDSPTIPRTYDTIMGVWEWYDVDGDSEPQGHIIHWFLNGTHVPAYDNKIEIPGVFAGQIWNFTIYPADYYGISSGVYGEPVHSPPVMVGNLPPTLNSVSITNKNPTTLTDLMASPGHWEDPETSVVTFNYLWERRTTTGYEALGAPNSPILDHRFTTRGDTIRVKAWVSDGITISNVRTAEVSIRNSEPYISSATLMPSVVDENTERIYIINLQRGDPDDDDVTVTYQWFVRGYPLAISEMYSEIQKSQGNWNFPSNITVGITPYDSYNLPGVTYYLTVDVTPTDTDGDDLYDDANGNGRNDPGDDPDDDNDGYDDEWEIEMGSDPKDPLDRPLDSDGDGAPNGDSKNSLPWMDQDDDNDGVWDIHPENPNMDNPVWYDTHPTTASMPGDYDLDGIGNNQDPDIDGDGYNNDVDAYPWDEYRWKEDQPRETLWIQILTLLLVLLIILAIAVFVYMVYNGTITLPSNAPPPVYDEGREAIYEEGGLAKLPPKERELEELEELETLSTCSNCGELVSSKVTDCPNCGATFEDITEEEGEEEEFDFDDFVED
ncbi:MAG: right-handed parallel beta-helix repeat-containing protein [Candidatus Thermoplasmatota archaeon]|nr:right-handed parallel beta-helix repeat-containing protein [Candidatus Thermoplasmatota archaeon]